MDIKKLAEISGKTFKSFNELSTYLGKPRLTGNAKPAFIKELARYIEYEQEGNKYIMKEVYPEPKQPIKIYRKDTIWVNEAVHDLLIDHILNLQEINKTDGIFLRRWEIAILVNLVTEQYYYNRKNFSLLADKDKDLAGTDFYKYSSEALSNAIKTCINSLGKMKSLSFIDTYTIKYTNGVCGYASGFQLQVIMDAKKEVSIKPYGMVYKQYLGIINKHISIIMTEDYPDSLGFKLLERGYQFFPSDTTIRRLKKDYYREGKSHMPLAMRKAVMDKLEDGLKDKFFFPSKDRKGNYESAIEKQDNYKREFCDYVDSELGQIDI